MLCFFNNLGPYIGENKRVVVEEVLAHQIRP